MEKEIATTKVLVTNHLFSRRGITLIPGIPRTYVLRKRIILYIANAIKDVTFLYKSANNWKKKCFKPVYWWIIEWHHDWQDLTVIQDPHLSSLGFLYFRSFTDRKVGPRTCSWRCIFIADVRARVQYRRAGLRWIVTTHDPCEECRVSSEGVEPPRSFSYIATAPFRTFIRSRVS